MIAGLRYLGTVQKGVRTRSLGLRNNPYHPIRSAIVVGHRLHQKSTLRNATHIPIHYNLFSTLTTSTMTKSSKVQEGLRVTATLRPATLDDATAISELATHVFTVTFGHSVEPHELQAFLEESYSLEAITKDLDDSNKDTLLAFDPTGDILGFAMLTRGSSEPCISHLDGTVELQRIYMYPKAQGTGAAKLLADRLEDMAREQEFKHMWLGVWEENLRAQKAYGKWGYEECGTHDFAIGSVIQTDNIMVKKL
ncbi:acetyltransferase [Colletotrichum abscissum]|uniref:Acetyltransferase n=1 Tax=Colletotrichum abscissum TaxID=1671311 RepID=A0A9P9XLV1_9PEZI|nr:acetyltransferase [Colletotrichum abscissum]KAI3555991.1 acetyltransferase [Colletotrichum abscissum]KAK1476430.1 acetyltransferase [Colletotrichum abscissum]